jgi:hypothetical protein
VFEKRHRLFQAVGGFRLFAFEFQEIQPLESSCCYTVSASELFHIVVEGDQKRFVRFRSDANQLVLRAASDDFLKGYKDMTMPDEDEPDSRRNAFVKKDPKSRPRGGRRARL